jgi:hypothetical protein
MRSYNAHDIITLPTLNSAAAVALGQGLLTAAKNQAELPPLIAARLAKFETAHGVLHGALSKRPPAALDPQRARNADLAEDQAWSALHDWLIGWSKIASPVGERARAMHTTLFPTGLKFTRLAYKLEWAEADARLARVASDGLTAEIEALGGAPILEQLRVTHQAYGEALGITAETQDTTVGLREPLQQFTNSLRAYVLAVAAHADEDDPASITQIDALLAPLNNWRSYISESATVAETASEATSATPVQSTIPVVTPPGTPTAPAASAAPAVMQPTTGQSPVA